MPPLPLAPPLRLAAVEGNDDDAMVVEEEVVVAGAGAAPRVVPGPALALVLASLQPGAVASGPSRCCSW